MYGNEARELRFVQMYYFYILGLTYGCLVPAFNRDACVSSVRVAY